MVKYSETTNRILERALARLPSESFTPEQLEALRALAKEERFEETEEIERILKSSVAKS